MPDQINPEKKENEEKTLKEKIQDLQQQPIVKEFLDEAKEIVDNLIDETPYLRTGRKFIKLIQKHANNNYNKPSSDITVVSSKNKTVQTQTEDEDIQTLTLRLKARL